MFVQATAMSEACIFNSKPLCHQLAIKVLCYRLRLMVLMSEGYNYMINSRLAVLCLSLLATFAIAAIIIVPRAIIAVKVDCPAQQCVYLPLVTTDSNHAITTVFVILMENQNWSSIKGNPSAPYINTRLLPQASYAQQYYNPPNI